ncbi:hypothetical protein VNI00_013091 [Paramarasmius palmivorus]|uniref:Uncharacterized protein n=1 Tax=Paramarasmius palmivorus TaxID=297713 RepID=A0AAW0C1V5_9AGAR
MDDKPLNEPDAALLQAVTGILNASWRSVADSSVLDVLTPAESDAVDALVNYLSRFVESHYQVSVENPQAAKALPTMTLICQNCSAVVNLPPPDSRWYCVTRGLRVGFVRGWDNVKRLVLHVPENKYTSHSNRETARRAFILSVASDEAHVVGNPDTAVAYDPVSEGDGFLFP